MNSEHLVRRFADLCNTRNIDAFGEVIAVDYTQHNSMIPPGLRGIQDGYAAFLAVFPDLSTSLEAIVSDGDQVVGRFTWRGTHSAEFMGVSATGRAATWTSMDWWRVAEGKLTEHWDVVDFSGLLAQLNATPATSR